MVAAPGPFALDWPFRDKAGLFKAETDIYGVAIKGVF